MTEWSYSGTRPGGSGHGTYEPLEDTDFGTGEYPADPEPDGHQAQRQRRSPQPHGFFAALFDFGFTSFVTPQIVKVLYVLIMVAAGLGSLWFGFAMMAMSMGLGVAALAIGTPLFFLVVTAIFRITLEFFIVIFRISEDIRALRENRD